MALIDPSKLVIVRATCESRGKTLHETKDCPRDVSCPVWLSLQSRAFRRAVE